MLSTFSLLVLIVYITIMVYVVYKARESVVEAEQQQQQQQLEGKVILTIAQEDLQTKLDEQIRDLNLVGTIAIQVPRDPVVNLRDFTTLPLVMVNNTTTYGIWVEWERSFLTTLGGQAQQLACLTPNLGQSQSPSLVPPGGQLVENFRSATLDGQVQPLVPPDLLLKLLDKGAPCQLSLQLVLRLQETGRFQNSYTVIVACPCSFRLPTLQDLKK